MQTIVREQQEHPVWGSYAQRLLDPGTELWRNPGSGGHDDKAHPPIHPTKFSAGESAWSLDHHVNTFSFTTFKYNTSIFLANIFWFQIRLQPLLCP